MITTDHKSKLPTGFSFPTGMRHLQESLGEFAGIDRVGVWYCGDIWAPDGRTRLSLFAQRRQGGSCPILVARYAIFHGPSACIAKGTRMMGHWNLNVYPVASPLRSIAKEKLEHEALPRIRQWLAAPRSSTWLEQSHQLEVSFDWTEHTVSFSESAR